MPGCYVENMHTNISLLSHRKFVNSHLKPYRCSVASCSNAHFSSAVLLNLHERQAHRMHGHPAYQVYNCTYKGCERSQEGRGFPRLSAFMGHMRRVHSVHVDGSIQNQAKEPESKE